MDLDHSVGSGMPSAATFGAANGFKTSETIGITRTFSPVR
jgi:hypothetical protein